PPPPPPPLFPYTTLFRSDLRRAFDARLRGSRPAPPAQGSLPGLGQRGTGAARAVAQGQGQGNRGPCRRFPPGGKDAAPRSGTTRPAELRPRLQRLSQSALRSRHDAPSERRALARAGGAPAPQLQAAA